VDVRRSIMRGVPQRFEPVAALREGAHVRAIAPSSPFSREDFERGVERLSRRYRVTFDEGIFSRSGFLAGDDVRRLHELRAALADPSVDAIVAVRGGYGATRLLDAIDPDEVRTARKLLIGFSDVTALHALFARAGLRSIHGAMIGGLGRASEPLALRWIAAVEGAPPRPIEGLTTIASGVAEGPLLGGNLALLAALAGTPHAPPLEGAILFLEDLGEAPYRLDRMLTTLRQSGALDHIAGVALGGFTSCGPRDDGTTAEAVLAERLGSLGLPVLSGVPAGHVDDNLELPLGAPVRLDAGAGRLVFLEGAVV
jgi:muramoyltetrapeptide carboxypeptidase